MRIRCKELRDHGQGVIQASVSNSSKALVRSSLKTARLKESLMEEEAVWVKGTNGASGEQRLKACLAPDKKC